MKEVEIKTNEAEQRLDKYLKKYLKDAPGSFLYKMLRKKNIVLNGKKASGNEKLHTGDKVKLFLSDETLDKFRGSLTDPAQSTIPLEELDITELSVLYEDAHILLVNKPVGMLSQKSSPRDISLVELVTAYLLKHKRLTHEELKTFRPSVCNRLDRNTSGLIVAGVSLLGLQTFGRMFQERTLEKYYLTLVYGKITRAEHIKGYLKKDNESNQVTVYEDQDRRQDASPVETTYIPVAYCADCTLLKVHLITGRTHQIRAHLSSVTHPVIGDYKYGNRKINDAYKSAYGITSQLLHSYELTLPEMGPEMNALSGRTIKASVPDIFYRIIKEIEWEHGTQEALGVLH